MTFMTKWLTIAELVETEMEQSRDEGISTSQFRREADEIGKFQGDPQVREEMAAALLDRIAKLPRDPGYRYEEPSGLKEIQDARPREGQLNLTGIPGNGVTYDKAYGAWLGRCVGCLLGQPVEGWERSRILGLLKATGNYPVRGFISSDVSADIIEKFKITNAGKVYGGNKVNWINNVSYMPEDDDTNYTVIALKLMEEHGFAFTPTDAAENWLMNLPILHVCTAERVAYRNLCNLLPPPRSAIYRNPYREWIGAQIRGDFFGYVTPGNPSLGAELAWRDASISHVKNGIYGEMFIAAMLSSAAVTSDIGTIIERGLGQIPAKSRLTEKVEEVVGWKKKGLSWEEALENVHTRYDEKNPHHWCHTISNAMIVCIGLLWGDGDLERSIGIALSGAFDTDCNAATVGSLVGMIRGAKALPDKWVAPLNNKLKSGIDGFGLVELSDLANRTVAISKAGGSR
jgi:ADP-ribosylglycohydrolase